MQMHFVHSSLLIPFTFFLLLYLISSIRDFISFYLIVTQPTSFSIGATLSFKCALKL